MEVLTKNENKIEYRLERKRIKNCYISVKDGQVVVRVPMKTSQERIEEIILKRANWIFENVKKQQKDLPKEYADGEVFELLGKEFVLKIVFDDKRKSKWRFMANKLWIILPSDLKEDSQKMTKRLVDDFYTQLAEKEVEKAMRKMSMKVGIAPNSYRIKNLKSTWGNCSSSGNVSVSKKLVQYSRHAIEYVCLHEICHLKYMNHSKGFWQMVEYYMPDYKVAEEELKK